MNVPLPVTLSVSLLWLVAVVLLWMWLSSQRRRETLDRLYPPPVSSEALLPSEPSGLRRWLFLAGYRQRTAPAVFIFWTFLAALAGLGTAFALTVSGVLASLADGLAIVPGGVGRIFQPLVFLGPWIPAVTLLALPTLVVRQSRRRIVMQIEQDLPITLELLATLGEIGMAFDSALQRLLDSQAPQRALVREFRLFQRDLLGGRNRVESLRRLASRVDVSSFTVFISAIVQAEQVGAGIAVVLRRQAEDLRDRRRERAMEFAMALPVKLLFPMVICFLPGIFVAVLGPTFNEFFTFVDSISRNRNL